MSHRRVTHDGSGRLQIHFPFDDRLKERVKSLPSRYWNSAQKHWSAPEATVVAVVDTLHDEGFDFCEVTLRLYRERGGARALEASGGALPRAAERPPGPGTGPSDLTVSQLNARIQSALEAAFPASVWLVGELSGYNKSAKKEFVSFLLVEHDDQGKVRSELKAVLFPRQKQELERRLAAARHSFQLEDGLQVRVRGRVVLKAEWGIYQFVLEELDLGYTLGEVARRREEILQRLAEEGLLEANRALPFPVLPLRVGLVTSVGSDAYHDVLRTFQESGFAFRIVAHSVRVQGRQTEPSVLNALDWFRDHVRQFDVLLICRGGGSRTDLSWFDSLAIARAVARFPLPVIIGIGHERDSCSLDFIGWRAKTPTAAAQLLVHQVERALSGVESRLKEILDHARQVIHARAAEVAERAEQLPRVAERLLTGREEHLAQLAHRIQHGAKRDLAFADQQLAARSSRLGPRAVSHLMLETERTQARALRLALLDPRRVLERGYALLRTDAGAVVTDAALVPRGTSLRAELKQGVLRLRSEGAEETQVYGQTPTDPEARLQAEQDGHEAPDEGALLRGGLRAPR